MSGEPIRYSDLSNDAYKDWQKSVPKIFSSANVNMLNEMIPCAHGVFVFMQYCEKDFIVNGFSEELFWNNINQAYVLFHDCGKDLVKFFLQPRCTNGFDCLSLFTADEDIVNSKFEAAIKNLQDFDCLRHSKYHNFKPDSESDRKKLEKCKAWFKEVCGLEHPERQNNWKYCNKKIVEYSDEIFDILKNRITYFKDNHTPQQMEALLEAYYEACKKSLDSSLYNAFKDANRRCRKDPAKTTIVSKIKTDGTIILEETIKKIRNSPKRADPYKALVETITLRIRM